MLPAIPPELVEEILEHAVAEHKYKNDPEKLENLLSFALVSQIWRTIAQKLLWKTIAVDPGNAGAWAASPAHKKGFIVKELVVSGAWKQHQAKQLSSEDVEKVLSKLHCHSIKKLVLLEIDTIDLQTLTVIQECDISLLTLDDVVMAGTEVVCPFIPLRQLMGIPPTYFENPRAEIAGAQDDAVSYAFQTNTIEITNCILTTPFLLSLESTQFKHMDFFENSSSSTACAVSASFKSFGSRLHQICMRARLAFHEDIFGSLTFLNSLQGLSIDIDEDPEGAAIVIQEILGALPSLKILSLSLSNVETEEEVTNVKEEFFSWMYGCGLTAEEIEEGKKSRFEQWVDDGGQAFLRFAPVVKRVEE